MTILDPEEKNHTFTNAQIKPTSSRIETPYQHQKWGKDDRNHT